MRVHTDQVLSIDLNENTNHLYVEVYAGCEVGFAQLGDTYRVTVHQQGFVWLTIYDSFEAAADDFQLAVNDPTTFKDDRADTRNRSDGLAS